MNIFDTAVINGVVGSLIAPQSALLDRYYPTVEVSDKEQVGIDVISGGRRVAPFVSPLVEGKIVHSRGYTTRLFTPAYVKPKFRFDPSRAFKRAAGEAIGGTLSPAERMQRALMADLEEGLEMMTRREEIMASEGLRTGQVTVIGDGYPEAVVDLKRHADLTSFTPAAPWDDPSADLIADLDALALLILKISGAAANDVILGVDAWKNFSRNTKVVDRLKQFNLGGTMLEPRPINSEGFSFMGKVDNYNLWTYAGWYQDPQDNLVKEIWPGETVALCSAAVQGVRKYGAIQDHEALVAQRYFWKSWLENDPSVRFLLGQSAPLPMTERSDAAASFESTT